MIVRVGTLALACALVLALPAQAGVIDKAQKEAEAAKSTQSWSAWGGDIGFRWNRGLLANIGVTVEAPSAQTDTTFASPASYRVAFDAYAAVRSVNVAAGSVSLNLSGRSLSVSEQLTVAGTQMSRLTLNTGGGSVNVSGTSMVFNGGASGFGAVTGADSTLFRERQVQLGARFEF